MKAKKVVLLAGLLLASFGASAGGFYIVGGIDYQWEHRQPEQVELWKPVPFLAADGSTRYTLEPVTVSPNSAYDITDARNPYGTIAVGFDWDWKYVTVDFELYRHRSGNVHDKGTNTTGLYIKVYPFGRR